MPVVIINSKISYSQKESLPTSYHIQNNSVVIAPYLEKGIEKFYKSNYENHIVIPSTSKSSQLTNTPSFTFVNATITVLENVANGITKGDSALSNQSIVTSAKKILNGKT